MKEFKFIFTRKDDNKKRSCKIYGNDYEEAFNIALKNTNLNIISINEMAGVINEIN